MESVQFLKEEFLESYPNQPEHMNELSAFIFYRTYSRWRDDVKRRETWKETCTRSINYNLNLAYKHLTKIGFTPNLIALQKEAEKLFDAQFNLDQFLSGRTLFVGGGENSVAEKYPLANFNCSFTNVEKWEDLNELFYLLLLGVGVGYKSTPEMAHKLPKIRIHTRLVITPYKPLPKYARDEHTTLEVSDDGIATIFVGDSKEGWTNSQLFYFHLLTKKEYEHIHTIKINVNSVRPAGERLLTFGGTASGPEPLCEQFVGIDNVLKNNIDTSLAPLIADEFGYAHVRPIHIMEIGNLIANSVVVGGVRRSSLIWLFSKEDIESLFAKYGINGFWDEEAFVNHELVREKLVECGIPVPAFFDDLAKKRYAVGYKDGDDHKTEWFDDAESAEEFREIVEGYTTFPANPGRPFNHRRMSNNSVIFETKPSRNFLNLIFQIMKKEGEPAFINMEEMRRRRPNAEGTNPCGEISLDTKQTCNLTTVVATRFVRKIHGRYMLDLERLLDAQRMSARAGLRMTLVELELKGWSEKQKRDRLTGNSMTGWKDAMELLEYTPAQEAQLLALLKKTIREEITKYAHELRIPTPLLDTTVKPEGTQSQLAGGVSPGAHQSHSEAYIRRIRVNAIDPLVQVAKELGWTVNPEVGQTWENVRTVVIDFPVYSGSKKTKDEVSAKEQLDTYFSFMKNYVAHNTSITVTVKPHEWEEVEDIIFTKWDSFQGVSFLAHDGGSYQLAPYEKISVAQYHELKKKMKPFDPALLEKYETQETEVELIDDNCVNGCPVR